MLILAFPFMRMIRNTSNLFGMDIYTSLFVCALESPVPPFLLMKTLKPVYAWFRQQNIRCSYYIDDSLNMNKDKAVCRNNTLTMVETLETLEFTVNYKKSSLVPSQRIILFWFIIDSVEFN